MVTEMIIAAFTQSATIQKDILNLWIKASYNIGGLLPTSGLSISVQSIGQIDILLRSMEDEFSSNPHQSHGFEINYQKIFSEFWVGSAYEITRLLRGQNLAPDNNDFKGLLRNLELLRMPLDKHEIASDKKLTAPLIMQRFPEEPGDIDIIYDKNNMNKSITMPSSITESGSITWCVLDTNTKNNFGLVGDFYLIVLLIFLSKIKYKLLMRCLLNITIHKYCPLIYHADTPRHLARLACHLGPYQADHPRG